jgi:hypothetical protein
VPYLNEKLGDVQTCECSHSSLLPEGIIDSILVDVVAAPVTCVSFRWQLECALELSRCPELDKYF